MRRFRLFLLAYLLPGLLVYACYAAFTYSLRLEVFGKTYAFQYFRRDMLNKTLRFPIRDPDLLILGDSGAKIGIAPRGMDDHFAVNLGVLYGNTLTAYQTLSSYLDNNKSPPCVLLLSKFEWKLSYGDFFNNLVKQGIFSAKEISRIWREGVSHNIYPATHYTAMGFWSRYSLQNIYLYDIDFARLQRQVKQPWRSWNYGEVLYRHERARGYAGDNVADFPTDEQFFREQYNVAILGDFQSSRTEDHYLRKLASLAEQNKISLFIGFTPIAESEMVARSSNFRSQRLRHLREVLSESKFVKFIELPESLPRDHFFEVTHPNAKGTAILTAELDRQLKGWCHAGGYNF